jgi:putative addiction module component (TIGR02574 family)
MQPTYEEVLKFAHALPEGQRLQLADALWESLDSDVVSAPGIDSDWNAEIARRVADVEAGTAVTYSLEEVEAELRMLVGP